MADLLVIVPSRGRPQSVARVTQAWRDTGAYGDADLLFAVDADDPAATEYRTALADAPLGTSTFEQPAWTPMVPKLNAAADLASGYYLALGFAGDDHLPRTPGWAGRYLDALRELETGIVYGDDLLQGERLPTQWAMTSDIVRALGRMVPAPVEHLYCDNAVMDLGRSAGCIRYLPDVVVEHMHPVAGKATPDDGYRRVNTTRQYAADHTAYLRWTVEGLAADAQTVRGLRGAVRNAQ